MVSSNLARAVVSAIVADDAKALKRAWLAFGAGLPQDLASKFVKQAWNHDRGERGGSGFANLSLLR